MKITYLIVAIILIGILAALQYHQKMKQSGLTDGTTKICATSTNQDCHYVENKLVYRVYEKALSHANADEAQTFPTLSSDDLETEYLMDQADLLDIYAEMVDELGLKASQYNELDISTIKSMQTLILFFHHLRLPK